MYTWNYSKNDEIWNHDEHETVDECIEDAKNNYGMKSGDTIAVGTIYPYEISVDVENVLERIEQDAYEECGEVSESWGISSRKHFGKEIDALQERLTACVNEYLKAIKEKPTFYKIDNIHTAKI